MMPPPLVVRPGSGCASLDALATVSPPAVFIVVTDLLRQAGRHNRFKADCVNALS